MNYKKHLCAALLALVPFTAFSQTTVNTPTAPAAAAADKSVPNAPAAIVQDEKQICDTLKKHSKGSSVFRSSRFRLRLLKVCMKW